MHREAGIGVWVTGFGPFILLRDHGVANGRHECGGRDSSAASASTPYLSSEIQFPARRVTAMDSVVGTPSQN
jgi:hypothetical protein